MQGACRDPEAHPFPPTLVDGDLVHLRGLQAATTFNGIELTNLYICMVLWAASALHFSVFRHSSTVIFAACLGVPPFASALVNLLLLGSEGTYPHLATWPLAGLSLLGILWIVRKTIVRAQASSSYHSEAAVNLGAMEHSSLEHLMSFITQARQSVRLNLALEFSVQSTLASLFWAYFVVRQRRASEDQALKNGSIAEHSKSAGTSTTATETPTRERARSRDDTVEETGEAAKNRGDARRNGFRRSSGDLGRRNSHSGVGSVEAKQQDEAEAKVSQDATSQATTPNAQKHKNGSALSTLFLRSLILYSVISCSIIFYAFCASPFADSWPYYLTFISPLFLMSLAPSVSLGIITTALLGEVFIFYESKREELQELLALFNKQQSDNEALRTTNIFSQEARDHSLRLLAAQCLTVNAAADMAMHP